MAIKLRSKIMSRESQIIKKKIEEATKQTKNIRGSILVLSLADGNFTFALHNNDNPTGLKDMFFTIFKHCKEGKGTPREKLLLGTVIKALSDTFTPGQVSDMIVDAIYNQ